MQLYFAKNRDYGKTTIVQAGKFKAECLKIMDQVHEKRQTVIITKHNKPIVKVVPIEEDKDEPLFGCMKGTIHIQGDIVQPIGEEWDACLYRT